MELIILCNIFQITKIYLIGIKLLCELRFYDYFVGWGKDRVCDKWKGM